MIVAFRSLLFLPALVAPSLFAQQSTAPAAAPPPQTQTQTPTQTQTQTPTQTQTQTPTQTPAQTSAPATSDALPNSPGAAVKPALQPTGPTVVFDTTMGRMVCRLYSKEAPNTVANFIALANGTKDWTDPATHAKEHNKPFYNGTTFHRVIPNFMIQGGDPVGDGTGDPGYMFADEFNPDLNFDVPGRLAMANSGPDTNGSQFFITEVPTEYLNQKHTIFGQCDDAALSVEKAIARVETGPNDKPITPVVLNKVTIVPEGAPLPAAPASPAAAAGSTSPQ